MHSNIETTIDRILAQEAEREFVKDLDPLRTRVISIESRPAANKPAGAMKVKPTLEDCDEESDSVDEIS